MACPFLEDVLDEEALILRRAFRHERVFRDRSDPLAFGDDYLNERYRFSGIFSGVLLGDKGYACKSFLLTLLVDPNPITAGLQPCTQQNKGSYQDDLRPSEISVSVPAPPEGFPGQGLLHVQ
ncbi:hypothetical protein N1851_027720 [Merluccius polli]|uniref:Uncharacterized protein n=1 Tax=Merluccius polli TaxID=89951 RepID=A0AA47MA94_MERPO|nr:hypothetical protein N1851_027720 [Merluccius polli]